MVSEIEEQIAYTFVDKELLNIAIWHPTNQRMAIVGSPLLIALVAFEGNELGRSRGVISNDTQRRTSKEHLAEVSDDRDLSQHIQIPRGQQGISITMKSTFIQALLGAAATDQREAGKNPMAAVEAIAKALRI